MATSGKHDEKETETSIDVSGFIQAFIGDDDDEKKGERSGDISMFCKACLHPYCGEQKSGTIVLRCERCGQTDTILEESVGSLKPQEWIGNLMMNRFITVVKEQEDLSANLSDPHFAEDEFRNITLFLAEYTFNIEKIVVHLYDIAKKAEMATEEDKVRMESCLKEEESMAGVEEVQAMNATKTLLDIHKTLIMNDPRQQMLDSGSENAEKVTETIAHQGDSIEKEECKNSDAEEKDASTDSLSDEVQKMNYNQENQTERSEEEANEIEQRREIVRDKLNQLGSSICSLIENLSVKYNIPDNVMVTVQKKLLNIPSDEIPETIQSTETETCHDIAPEDDKECSNNEKEIEGAVGSTSDEGNNVKDDNSDKENETEKSQTIFNVTTETIRQEVYNALSHKLKLSYYDTGSCAERKIDWDQTEDSILKCPPNKEPMNGNDNSTLKGSQDTPNNDDAENASEEKAEDCIEGDKEINDAEAQNETFEVNFYTLACEFIRELQRRKNKALCERKNKALSNIHDKIERLKQEMERVEDAVTEELALAYKRKMKKVEKQKKQLNEKQSQVKEVERLLEFYVTTGQDDKVAELIEQFDIQYEN